MDVGIWFVLEIPAPIDRETQASIPRALRYRTMEFVSVRSIAAASEKDKLGQSFRSTAARHVEKAGVLKGRQPMYSRAKTMANAQTR